ncbi:MAG TPA: hypothetical protein VLZ78_10180 [Terrimesophilobacter sp.]|nr:hypothetical protein [Terrimesophilobacter sp.]
MNADLRDVRLRKQMAANLRFVGEHADDLTAAYAVRADAYDVVIQGERDALAVLVAKFGAVLDERKTDDNYREWTATVDGVQVRLIEERWERES